MASVAGAGRLRAFSALRHRDFRWFFLNIGVQSFGQGIQFLGIGYLVLDLTGDQTSLGLAVSLFGVSNLFFTFVGGVLADRVDRKLFLIVCVLGNAVVTLALAFLALTGLAQMWHVYAVVFILGGLMAVQMPARFALAADLVPREDMMNAVALHTSVGQIGNMTGPLVGGWAIQYIDTWAGIMINGVSYLVGIVFLMMVTRPVATTRRNSSPISDLVGGFAHAIRTPMAAVLIIMSASFGFFRHGLHAGRAGVHHRISPTDALPDRNLHGVQGGRLVHGILGGCQLGRQQEQGPADVRGSQPVLRCPHRDVMGPMVLGGVRLGGLGGIHQHRGLLACFQLNDAADHRPRNARTHDGNDATRSRLSLPGSLAAHLAGASFRLVGCHHRRSGRPPGYLAGRLGVSPHGSAHERGLTAPGTHTTRLLRGLIAG